MVERAHASDSALGNFLERKFSFETPVLAISRAHIMGEKPSKEKYQVHKADSGTLQAGELSLDNLKTIQTMDKNYNIPLTVGRGAAADIF